MDFLVTVKNRPWFAVEAKVRDETPAKALRYFGERLQIPLLYQVVLGGHRDFESEGVRVVPAPRFLASLA